VEKSKPTEERGGTNIGRGNVGLGTLNVAVGVRRLGENQGPFIGPVFFTRVERD
jgi:hypothetical protein